MEFDPHASARRAVTLSLAALALAPALAESKPGHVPPHQPLGKIIPGQHVNLTEHTPLIGLGNQDDATIDSGNRKEINQYLDQARGMGVSWLRILIHPDKLSQLGWRGYDQGVLLAHAKGMNVSITAACDAERWQGMPAKQYTRQFTYFVTRIATRYAPYIKEMSNCNEPNYPGSMAAMPGKSPEATYRSLYIAGYKAEKRVAPKVDVLFGDLSSEVEPLKFFRGVLKCSKTAKKCAPILTNALAYHPYQQTNSPNNRFPDNGEVGIGQLPVIETELKQAYAAGEIETPSDHELPKVSLTEFAYQTAIRGETSDPNIPVRQLQRYLPGKVRDKYYIQSLQVVCRDPNVNRLSFLGFNAPSPDWPGPWDSPFRDLQGNLLSTYFKVQQYVKQRVDCFRQTSGNIKTAPSR
jgi:hypothetical protein